MACEWFGMKSTASTQELSSRIEELVREHIAASRRTAEEALQRAFGVGVAAPGQRPVQRAAPGAVRAGSGKRRASSEMALVSERLYAVVCGQPGAPMAAFAVTMGVSPRELDRPMAQLKKAGRVRCVGQRSLMRYFPLTGRSGSPG